MTTRQINGSLSVVAIVVVLWSVIASFLWCYWSNVCNAGEWPLLQWWFILPRWLENWYVTLLVIGSGGMATAVAAFCLRCLWFAIRPRNRQPNLYGTSQFADRREMARGGIKTRRRPF